MTPNVMKPPTPTARVLHLTKHHGAGNDFLVLVDGSGRAGPTDGRDGTGRESGIELDPTLVRALCDRRFGVGADGFIRVSPADGPAELVMDLRNADGSVAEMSGNGIRCLAQAAVEAGLVEPPTFTVDTLAGLRTVEYRPGNTPGLARASVGMGKAELGPEQSPGPAGRKARLVDMGNPHLVVLVPGLADVDVEEFGLELQSRHPGGINVECIALGPGPDTISLDVWERGVGLTLACGTGSAAAAAAAHSWGLVGERVVVNNPGGALDVVLATDGISLEGPVRKVADVEVVTDELLSAARP
jgi:diaminopimelate epimerase